MKKVLLISGGSAGIGKATALCFAQHGYVVYEMSRRAMPEASAGKQETIVHLKGDVTHEADCRQVVDTVWEREGRIDVLICNAGMGISGAIEFTSSCDMHRQMDVNFFGTVHLVQAVLPHMREQKKGHILLVGSIAGVFAIPYQSFYSASKAAVAVWASSLRNEVRDFGIQVSCLLPGDVKTSFSEARVKNEQGTAIYTHLRKSVSTMERDESKGLDANKMAIQLLRMAQTKHPYLYYTVGWKYHLFLWAQKLVPATLINYVLGKMY